MRLDDAWRELGIEPTADPEAVRRAYLRGLKTRRPERDPEGFRRLRAAYELLAGRLSTGWRPRAVPVAIAVDDAPAVPADVAPEGPPEDVDEDVPADELELRLRRWIAARPRDPEPYWRLLDLLRELAREREVPMVLRAADAAGLPGFFDELVTAHAATLTGGEIERLAAGDDPDQRVTLAGELAVRGEGWSAATRLREALDLADAQGCHDRPLAGGLLRALLRLHAAGAVAPAVELTERVARRWRTAGIEQRVVGEELAASWILLRELARLPADTPRDVRAALASAVLSGDPAATAAFLERRAARDGAWAHQLLTLLRPQPALSRLFVKRLEALAPGVPNVVAPPLAATVGPTSRLTRGTRALLLCWLVFAFVGYLGVIIRTAQPAKQVAAPSALPRSPAVRELCVVSDELCLRGLLLQAAVDSGSCERMRDWLARCAELALSNERAAARDRFLAAVRESQLQSCSEEGP